MSIIAAKKAFGEGFGELGQVLSGTMRYDNTSSPPSQVFTFRVQVDQEIKEYLIRIANGVNWHTELPRRGKTASDALKLGAPA